MKTAKAFMKWCNFQTSAEHKKARGKQLLAVWGEEKLYRDGQLLKKKANDASTVSQCVHAPFSTLAFSVFLQGKTPPDVPLSIDEST